jgi:hypothetical protein
MTHSDHLLRDLAATQHRQVRLWRLAISYSITSSAVASSVARIFDHDDIHIKSDQIACGGGDLFSFSALAGALIMTRCV